MVSVQDVMPQHAAVVNRVVMEYALFCPVVIDISSVVIGQVKCTHVELNDGRQRSVVTQVEEDAVGVLAETLVSDWERLQEPSESDRSSE